MKLHTEVFSLEQSVRNPALTEAEHEGLCCLVERARYFGGGDDVFFLCLTEGLLLVRLHCGQDSKWTADGFLFDGKQESWVWIFLPVCIRALFSEQKSFEEVTTEALEQAEQWLAAHRPALWTAVSGFCKNTARLLHPHSVAFSCLEAEQYGRCNADWYRTASDTILGKPRSIAEVAERTEAGYEDIFLAPPMLMGKNWRVVQDGTKYKLGELDDIEDWKDLEDRIFSVL